MDGSHSRNQGLGALRKEPPRQAYGRGAICFSRVDGGSEFNSVFEAACEARRLELFVLPPKHPELNGCVERAQSAWRYEF